MLNISLDQDGLTIIKNSYFGAFGGFFNVIQTNL